MEMLFRLVAALGPKAFSIIMMFGGLAAILVLYLGIAMRATLHAHDPEEQQIRYQIFRDLLEVFLRARRR